MPLRIWKFALLHGEPVMMPSIQEILAVHGQADNICLWAAVDPTTPLRPERFAIYPTGAEIPDAPGRFLGTVLLHGGALVFHVYKPV